MLYFNFLANQIISQKQESNYLLLNYLDLKTNKEEKKTAEIEQEVSLKQRDASNFPLNTTNYKMQSINNEEGENERPLDSTIRPPK